MKKVILSAAMTAILCSAAPSVATAKEHGHKAKDYRHDMRDARRDYREERKEYRRYAKRVGWQQYKIGRAHV